MPKPWSLSSKQDNNPYASSPTTRTPINIARLLEVYDDYPNLVADLQTQTSKLDQALNDVDASQAKYEDIEDQLSREKALREEEAEIAKEDKRKAEIAREEKIRNELQPKIDTLTKQLKEMTASRDTLQKELTEHRTKAKGWISKMETLHKERIAGEEKEKKAAEERAGLAVKLRELDEEILDGLRIASNPPPKVESKSDGASIRKEGSVRRAGDTASVRKEGSVRSHVPFEGATKKDGSVRRHPITSDGASSTRREESARSPSVSAKSTTPFEGAKAKKEEPVEEPIEETSTKKDVAALRSRYAM